LKNKIILTGLFLTTAISCSNFRPVVLTNAFLDPESTTSVDYEDLNFSYALFNQYASGLDYKLRLNYSNQIFDNLNSGLQFETRSGPFSFDINDWDIITSTFAEVELNTFWKSKVNEIFFDRDFNRTTKLPPRDYYLQFVKRVGDTVNLEWIIESKIRYNVNIGSVYKSFRNLDVGGVTSMEIFLELFNDNQKLQSIRLTNDTSGVDRDYLFGLSTVVTNVNKFKLVYRFVDVPPYVSNISLFRIYEFNIFTQGAEISIPDGAEDSIFGFEFVAVEWWNILGHLQNFAWWIVNKSPISPVFVWLDTYVITWISGLITFITGVFGL